MCVRGFVKIFLLASRKFAFKFARQFFVGSPLYDLARFITCCADAEIRRGCARAAIDAYYARLTENFAKHNAKPKFTKQQVNRREYL